MLAYKINYKKSVTKDLNKIDKKQCKRLLNKIEKELSLFPEKGKELVGNFKGLFSYRSGDYRVIYSILADNNILILRVAHRKEVYK
ncbi:TPA: addiction module toxin RelE [bacterium]|nr:MAG: addiction module toxin RelE [Candidatus Hydrogenedentes bacterium CG07_land_8_20_14_0_80_42_17]HBW47403.1 addiction module toxin RelE [bacterium]